MSEGPSWFARAIGTPRRDRQVEVEGCPIHYLQWGESGRPGIVFVHGGAAHAHWWTFIAPHFLPEYQVVALDLSGHGDSGRREDYPRELWASEVLAVAEGAGFDAPPIVIGHSMGGFVSIAAAALYGDRLAGAVILDSPVTKPDPEAEEGARGPGHPDGSRRSSGRSSCSAWASASGSSRAARSRNPSSWHATSRGRPSRPRFRASCRPREAWIRSHRLSRESRPRAKESGRSELRNRWRPRPRRRRRLRWRPLPVPRRLPSPPR